jgi:hypothetical protein
LAELLAIAAFAPWVWFAELLDVFPAPTPVVFKLKFPALLSVHSIRPTANVSALTGLLTSFSLPPLNSMRNALVCSDRLSPVELAAVFSNTVLSRTLPSKFNSFT